MYLKVDKAHQNLKRKNFPGVIVTPPPEDVGPVVKIQKIPNGDIIPPGMKSQEKNRLENYYQKKLKDSFFAGNDNMSFMDHDSGSRKASSIDNSVISNAEGKNQLARSHISESKNSFQYSMSNDMNLSANKNSNNLFRNPNINHLKSSLSIHSIQKSSATADFLYYHPRANLKSHKYNMSQGSSKLEPKGCISFGFETFKDSSDKEHERFYSNMKFLPVIKFCDEVAKSERFFVFFVRKISKLNFILNEITHGLRSIDKNLVVSFKIISPIGEKNEEQKRLDQIPKSMSIENITKEIQKIDEIIKKECCIYFESGKEVARFELEDTCIGKKRNMFVQLKNTFGSQKNIGDFRLIPKEKRNEIKRDCMVALINKIEPKIPEKYINIFKDLIANELLDSSAVIKACYMFQLDSKFINYMFDSYQRKLITKQSLR